MKIRQGLTLIVIGIILIIFSVYPLFLMIRESVLETYVDSKYEIEQMINIRNKGQMGKQTQQHQVLTSPFQWEGNSIEVLTEDTGLTAPKTSYSKIDKNIMKISIKINGKEISSPTEAWLPLNDIRDARFLSWLNIVKIKDKKNNEEQIAIVQRLTGEVNVESQQWRVLFVNKDKQINEEGFSYVERGKHLLGVKLVQLSSQSSSFIGYKSDISYLLPSLLFPLVYPTGTCLIGVVLLIVGYVRKKRR
ncbi:hypothetical protein [Paenibacillus sedimenti]|uniref:Uncharacterized protein n=1 Tax=Paenibacillus sedimenti TaxID=2770274 RepID=A0A926KNP6_9BACL|nr:hypothetical protein [Paenibacillus sedimenti]MBD0379583.1 hypothetical protein [Paenibacillus sedimenti]